METSRVAVFVERGAGQRTCPDDAFRRRGGEAGVVDEARFAAGDCDGRHFIEPRALRILAQRVAGNTIGAVVFRGEQDAAAIVGESAAGGELGAIVEVVAVVCLTDRDFALDAFILRVEDEVHDAGHGVRTVSGRGAAGHRIDPCDQARWNVLDVNGGGDRAEYLLRHETLAVQQDEVPERAKVAQVQERSVGDGVAALGRRRRATKRGNFNQRVDDGRLRRSLKLFEADNAHRHRGFLARCNRDARTRHDDAVFLRRGRGGRLTGLCESRLSSAHRDQHGDRRGAVKRVKFH